MVKIVLDKLKYGEHWIDSDDFARDLWPGDGKNMTLKERILADVNDEIGYAKYADVLKDAGVLTAAEATEVATHKKE